MGIMAAGMHGSRVLGFVRRIPQFRNGQGIDVRPDPDDPVRGMGSLQGGDHPGFAGFHIGDPQRIQIGFNGLLGLEFFPGPFRFFMKWRRSGPVPAEGLPPVLLRPSQSLLFSRKPHQPGPPGFFCTILFLGIGVEPQTLVVFLHVFLEFRRFVGICNILGPLGILVLVLDHQLQHQVRQDVFLHQAVPDRSWRCR